MAVRSTMFAHAALESGSNLKSVGGFGVVATQEELPLEGQNLVRPETLRPSHSPIVRSNSEPSLSAAWTVGISILGFSIGYTLDAVGPIVVASMLSIFVFKEMTQGKQLMLYWGSFTLQLAGVLLMTFFSEHK
eukprot:g19043.t1